jgi:hypothetical protein
LFIGKKGAHHQNTPDHSVPLIDNHQYFQTPGLDPQHDLIIFENQVDCSKAVDLYGGARIVSPK